MKMMAIHLQQSNIEKYKTPKTKTPNAHMFFSLNKTKKYENANTCRKRLLFMYKEPKVSNEDWYYTVLFRFVYRHGKKTQHTPREGEGSKIFHLFTKNIIIHLLSSIYRQMRTSLSQLSLALMQNILVQNRCEFNSKL